MTPDARYYLIIDLEATTSDDGSLPPEQLETIEIGGVLADAKTLDPVGEFQTFIRPVRHPILLPFCTKLTSITQAMVGDAPLFPEAFAALRARLIDHRHPSGARGGGTTASSSKQRLRAARDREPHAART